LHFLQATTLFLEVKGTPSDPARGPGDLRAKRASR